MFYFSADSKSRNYHTEKKQPPHNTGMQRTTLTHLGSTHLLSRCVRDNLCVSRNLPTFTVITPAFMSKNSLRGIWQRAKHFFLVFSTRSPTTLKWTHLQTNTKHLQANVEPITVISLVICTHSLGSIQ